MLGEEELASGSVRIKQLGLGEQNKGDLIEREKMVEAIVDLLRKSETCTERKSAADLLR
jgi:hypothetical protein